MTEVTEKILERRCHGDLVHCHLLKESGPQQKVYRTPQRGGECGDHIVRQLNYQSQWLAHYASLEHDTSASKWMHFLNLSVLFSFPPEFLHTPVRQVSDLKPAVFT